MLPKGWIISTFNDLDILVVDGDRGKNYPKKEEYLNNGHCLFLGAENIIDGDLDLNKKIFIPESRHTSLGKGVVEFDDILLVMRGNGTGRACLYSEDKSPYKIARINSGLAIIRINQLVIAKEFMIQLICSAIIIKQFESYMFGSAQPQLTIQILKSLLFPIPPLLEQIKIAEILSTWDNAINTVQKLLTNSQQQKKSLMQQLLTGKKRFAGFEGEWEEKRLGEFCEITTGKSNREDSTLESGAYTFFDRSQDIRTSDIYLFDAEAVIVAGEGQDFIPKHFIGKFDLHQRTYAIMGFSDNHGKFIYFYLTKNKNYLLSQAVGSTVKSLRLPMFQKMPILLPLFPEQQKIAAVLTTADQEIDNLRAQLNHLKKEKKALMQQLLTGKRRVRIEDAA